MAYDVADLLVDFGTEDVRVSNIESIDRNTASVGELSSLDIVGEDYTFDNEPLDVIGDPNDVSDPTSTDDDDDGGEGVDYGTIALGLAKTAQAYFKGQAGVEGAQASAQQQREQGQYLKEQAYLEAQKIVDDERFAQAKDRVAAANTGFVQAGDFDRGGTGAVSRSNQARADASAAQARQRGDRAEALYNRLAEAQTAAAKRRRDIGVGSQIGGLVGTVAGAAIGGPGGAAIGGAIGTAGGGYIGSEL